MFLQTTDANPNGWAVLIALIGMLGTILTTIVTYLLNKRDTTEIRRTAEAAAKETISQTPKLDTIHVLVNGRVSALQDENTVLKARVAALESGGTSEPK